MQEKKEEQFDEKRCREAVNYDLKMAIAFLNVLYRQPEILKAVEDLVVERSKAQYENRKKNPELEFNG